MIIVFTIVWGTGSNAISIAHDMDMLFCDNCDNCINCANDEGRGQRKKGESMVFAIPGRVVKKITLFFGVL